MNSKTSFKPRSAGTALPARARDGSQTSSSGDTSDALRLLVRRYQKWKRPISVNFRRILPALNSPDRLTHLIHPYPAKLLVHIPVFFLATDLLSKRGDVVLDPFCGSGTVLLEAQMAHRLAYGVDANPLARLIARTKTTPLDGGLLEKSLVNVLKRTPQEPSGNAPDVVNLNHWFFPHVVRQLQCLRETIERLRCAAIRDFLLVCFSACVRKVSLADPRLSVPVRLRRGQYPKKHLLRAKCDAHLRQLRRVRVADVFARIARTNIARMKNVGPHSNGMGPAEIVCSDARRLEYEYSSNGNCNTPIPDESVQLIITSPPYPGAQKYIRSCSLSLGWLGLCPTSELRQYKARAIGREEFTKRECDNIPATKIAKADKALARIRKRNPVRAAIAATYLNEMREAMREMCRVLRQGGHVVLVAANNQIAGSEFRTVDYLRAIAEEYELSLTACLIDSILSRGLMTKRNHTASVITREWVLLLTKGGIPVWTR
ncbi:MAG TPA: class I SAM-dependent methyltransferase [Phycisphaerae bacterium]|nr:class I SAM-dependent methyltransferase [Phycisphaerae bacterium]